MNTWTAKFIHRIDGSLCFSDALPLDYTPDTVGVCLDHDRLVNYNPLYGEDDD